MLLLKLQTKEKFAFLELAHHIALVDGDYSVKEKNLIIEFCAQMGIEDKNHDDETFNLDETLAHFKSIKSKKIAIMSLMILVHIDDKYDIHEYKMICKTAQIFGLSELDINLYSQWGKSVTGLYSQARLFIED